MLGVLRMDIDSCIKEYLDMAPTIFPTKSLFSGSKLGKLMKGITGKPQFNPDAFETVIKKLIADHLKTRSPAQEHTMLAFEASTIQSCRVYVQWFDIAFSFWRNENSFVCVTSEKLRKHFRFRSYESLHDVHNDCLIWEACRATSAAPTFFPPMVIGNPPTAYVDGGLGYNNPIRPLMEEARRVWPERQFGCILSIGTGIPEYKDVGKTILPLIETLKAMAVDTEKVAREVSSELGLLPIYFRFNVSHGLQQVGLEEWKEFDRTKIATEDYLNQRGKDIDLCASRIWKPSGTL